MGGLIFCVSSTSFQPWTNNTSSQFQGAQLIDTGNFFPSSVRASMIRVIIDWSIDILNFTTGLETEVTHVT